MNRSANGEVVTIPGTIAGARTIDAYRVSAEGAGPHPAVLIIHEAFGINDNIRDIAHRFANEGYVALALDLFSHGNRVVCMFRLFYGLLVRPLENGTVATLRSALDFVQKQPQVDPVHVGVIGFCMGGSYALQIACVEGELKAASVFYAMNPRPLEAVSRACPIVGSYPNPDFTTEHGRKLDQILNQLDKRHDIKIYDGARHSFFNDSSRNYDPEAAADSWMRTLAFFRQYLNGSTAKP